MRGRNRVLGIKGENIAARFLSRKGYKIIGRNVRLFVGEIDIVAKKGPFFVFVEVKTRESLSFGAPYLSVTWKKKKKLALCALCYLNMRNMSDAARRIDIVSVEIDGFSGQINKIEHFKNAVEE